MTEQQLLTKQTKKDFESNQDVRWCPGCGDYSILATMQRFLPSLNLPMENYVFVSGIGCSSRFPYYMNTYGFHTIHGRAPAIATGLKLANPQLSVWLVTGDGDALSIGGNHLIHILRRNPNIKILLFNNRIYGLTKGQYSPTSEQGKVTGSTPYGSVDHPLNPLLVALGANATFVARSVDVEAKHLTEVFRQANEHQGTAFIEIYQNCNIFNDGAFDHLSDRAKKDDTQLQVCNGELLVFGKEKNKGIKLNGLKPEVVEFTPGDLQAAQNAGVARYDATDPNFATLLARLSYPDFPVPFGVLFRQEKPTLDDLVVKQVSSAKAKKPINKDTNLALRDLYQSADTWIVR
jgi:2-oxoglutarate ferredoxin oxidoreductase subunit beta